MRVIHHVPFSGDTQAFFVRPTTWAFNTPRAAVGNNELQLVQEAEQLKDAEVIASFDAVLKSIETNLDRLRSSVDPFNADLIATARGQIESRRKYLLDMRKLIDSLSDRLVKGQLAEIEASRGLMREMLAQIVFDRANLRPGQDVISFVGDADITSVRTLLTWCYQLVAQAYGDGEVTVRSAKSLLRKLGVKKGATDEKVVTSALQAMGIGIQLSEMQGAKINRDLKSIRNRAIMQLVEEKKLPQSLIAGAFGISIQAVSKIVKGGKKRT